MRSALLKHNQYGKLLRGGSPLLCLWPCCYWALLYTHVLFPYISLYFISSCTSWCPTTTTFSPTKCGSTLEYYAKYHTCMYTWNVIPLKLHSSILCPFISTASTNEGSLLGGRSAHAPFSDPISVISSFFLEWSIGQRAFSGSGIGPQSR